MQTIAAPAAPPELTAALETNPQAATVFSAFSPSCQRAYIDWIVSAKRLETREKRVVQAVAMIAEGKQHGRS